MDKAAAQKLIEPATRTNFARNTLVAIVPADSTRVPEGRSGSADSPTAAVRASGDTVKNTPES